MTPESLYLGLLLAGALIAFYTEWMRPDVTAFLVMIGLIVPWQPTATGELKAVLSLERGLSGFGSPAVIMVASMFALSGAMVHTGAAQLIGGSILRAGARSELRLQLTILVVVSLFSGFINDTTTVLLWMPLVLAVCRDHGYAPSRLLLLLAYASLLGGQWTLIGTRSNIVISDYLRVRSGQGLGFFSFTPTAACVLLVAVAFFAIAGRKLLPRRVTRAIPLSERYEVTEYLTEVLATPQSDLIGGNLGELGLEERFGVKVLQVIRGEEHLPPSSWLRLSSGDVLVVQGRVTQITDLLERSALRIIKELMVGERALRSVDLRMVEAVVAPGSPYEAQTLDELKFPVRHRGLSVLAINRHGRPLTGRPTAHRMRAGDSLLLIGHASELDSLGVERGLLLLESRPFPPLGRAKAYVVIALMLFIALASSLRLLHPALAIPVAALLAVLFRCVSMRQVYASIDLQALVVVGSLIPFGYALEETGTAHLLGDLVATTLAPFGLHAVFAALLLASVLLTQVIENTAVAVILAPLAHALAVSAGGNPKAFLLGVAICISAAFTTPVAHESTILVMVPGQYRFADYLRLGVPLAALTWLVTTVTVPLFFPLRAG
ncbi:MAG: SLC13 family permease [Candidatus Schekmanbacteria bacterium]|nr:SLC13 family permease [Candidatus Schekmanbacteria bacterium]